MSWMPESEGYLQSPLDFSRILRREGTHPSQELGPVNCSDPDRGARPPTRLPRASPASLPFIQEMFN